jgi:hypothetical protein
MVKLSNGDVTSDLRRPLAAEIDIPPILSTEKTHITCEWYTIDAKHIMSTNRKPWSTTRLVTYFRSVTSSNSQSRDSCKRRAKNRE